MTVATFGAILTLSAVTVIVAAGTDLLSGALVDSLRREGRFGI
jgi:hypothetical protein